MSDVCNDRCTNTTPGGIPDQQQQTFLSDLIPGYQKDGTASVGRKSVDNEIHTLLENDLGVQLPLHISLTRPLALKTTDKDKFLADLTTAIAKSSVRSFNVFPENLTWHPNEDGTRWFLVLSLRRPENDELRRLLRVCNRLVGDFGQPLLYQVAEEAEVEDGRFHLSVAWSLSPQEGAVKVSANTRKKFDEIRVDLGEVKARIGQDVMGISLRRKRGGLFEDEPSFVDDQ